jgi:hypothetical protein
MALPQRQQWFTILFVLVLISAFSSAGGAQKTLLPDAPSYTSYQQVLNSSDKLDLFLRRAASVDILVGTTFDAGWAQLTDDWPSYGRGMPGFGKRWGTLMADREARIFFGTFLLPTVLHQDPRYLRLGPGHPLLSRIGYAFTRVAVARKDSGGHTLNSSLLLSTVLVKALANAYYPQTERGFSRTVNRVEGSLVGSAQGYMLIEFLPDITGICRKHEPERLKRLERRLPFLRRVDAGSFFDTEQSTQK